MQVMKPIEVLPDFYFIQRGFLNANHFVGRGPSPVLIDSAYIAGLPETEQQIVRMGVRLRDVRLIVSTHCHCDHIGANREIQRRSGCDIALHPLGKHFIDTRDDWATWWRYYGQQGDFFDATRVLADGEVLAVGPHEFEVLHTPGHAADGIVLYHRRQKVLLSSDTLWKKDMAVMTVRVEGSSAPFRMLDSLDRIAALNVRTVFPGHGPPFTDFTAAVDRARRRLEGLIADRRLMGRDLLKKIIVYTLMMHTMVDADGFFDLLMATIWFPETVDLYFEGRYREVYEDVMTELLQRGLAVHHRGRLSTTVPP